MSNRELNTWLAYTEKNGPLNMSLRVESAIARAVAPFLRDAKPADLMVWPRKPDQPATLDGVFSMFKGLAGKTRKRK